MKYCFDLDETICLTPSRDYSKSIPYAKVIDRVNHLFDAGHNITIFTARGSSSGIDHRDLTEGQLKSWGVKYHELIMGKPDYDIFVDDKAINAAVWRRREDVKIVGLVASAFDLLHAGHCLYLKEAKSVCDYLIACLHIDPSIERPSKNKPIQSYEERLIQLKSNKYVDSVYSYETEKELLFKITTIKPDIRILGSDCVEKITGGDLCPIYYINRNHNWSSTNLRERIKNA